MYLLKLPGLAKPVALNSIICAQGHGNYTWLYATNQPKYLWAATLKWVETQSPGFIRIHKASLINPVHVVQVRVDGPHTMIIQMTNGMSLAVARRRVERVRQQLEEIVQAA